MRVVKWVIYLDDHKSLVWMLGWFVSIVETRRKGFIWGFTARIDAVITEYILKKFISFVMWKQFDLFDWLIAGKKYELFGGKIKEQKVKYCDINLGFCLNYREGFVGKFRHENQEYFRSTSNLLRSYQNLTNWRAFVLTLGPVTYK